MQENPLLMGSGAQRSIVNSLLMLWARIENQKPKKDKKIFHSSLSILLYEEPESLLHYDQEKKLLKNLEQISKSANNQIFMCTHSPNLISTKINAINSITRFTNGAGQTETFKGDEIYIKSLEAKKSDFDFTLWLNPDRNTMFFVEKAVLVEGSADKVFLNYIIDSSGLEENLYVIDCGWKGNIPLFIKLAETFGIPHLVMFDQDDNKITKEVNHKAINDSIIKSKNKFTLDMLYFPKTLEDYIGFDKTGTYDKPLVILNQLRGGKLKKDKETEFINFLRK